jgi:hypothetical protein
LSAVAFSAIAFIALAVVANCSVVPVFDTVVASAGLLLESAIGAIGVRYAGVLVDGVLVDDVLVDDVLVDGVLVFHRGRSECYRGRFFVGNSAEQDSDNRS